MEQMPAVVAVLAVEAVKIIVVQVLREDSIVHATPKLAAILRSSKSLVYVSASRNQQSSMSVSGAFRDDVNHPIHRIRAPYGSTGTADHFDSLDVLQRHILRVPIDPAEKRRINRPAVDQHQKFVRKLQVEAARGNRPGIRVDLSHIQSRNHPQEIWYIRGPGSHVYLPG